LRGNYTHLHLSPRFPSWLKFGLENWAEPLDGSTAVMHFRGGDIFGPNAHRKYAQPVCAHYLAAFEHSGASCALIVAEDKKNPCAREVERALPCVRRAAPCKELCAFTLLARARVLVTSNSSFVRQVRCRSCCLRGGTCPLPLAKCPWDQGQEQPFRHSGGIVYVLSCCCAALLLRVDPVRASLSTSRTHGILQSSSTMSAQPAPEYCGASGLRSHSRSGYSVLCQQGGGAVPLAKLAFALLASARRCSASMKFGPVRWGCWVRSHSSSHHDHNTSTSPIVYHTTSHNSTGGLGPAGRQPKPSSDEFATIGRAAPANGGHPGRNARSIDHAVCLTALQVRNELGCTSAARC
jgi:hypothetical protein